METKTVKMYCKKCGNPVDNDIKKCTSCGKQYLNKRILFHVLCVVLVLTLLAVNVVQYISYTNNGGNRFFNNRVIIVGDGAIYHRYGGCPYATADMLRKYPSYTVTSYDEARYHFDCSLCKECF